MRDGCSRASWLVCGVLRVRSITVLVGWYDGDDESAEMKWKHELFRLKN